MIDKELIKNKLAFIQKELENLSKYKGFSLNEIADDYVKHAVIEN